ncbi:MAG: hypothetical protein H7X77_02295 [Anaerolineae bacterium]|nr:hypothetical protein [Anaerolineae bacterium]
MQKKSSLFYNAMWFMASLGLALIVWLIATTQADPIVTRSFTTVPVQLQPPAGLILTGANRRTVTVNIRARQSVMDLLTDEDITVLADLDNMSPGTQVVQLEALVSQSRQALADTKPAQITVTLEQEQSEQKPVQVEILNPPPVGYILGETITSESQMLVTGVLSKVQQVVRLEAQLDLSQQRTTLSEEVDLVPVDMNGVRVTDVTIAQPVRVTVEITQDEAVKQVFVTPNINRASLSDAYVFLGIIDYVPKTISVTGTQEALSILPDILQTEQIDLASATEQTTFNVLVQLPEGIFLAEPGQTIEVIVGIEAREEIKQLDAIPVEITGQTSTTTVRVTPAEIIVLVRGPQPIVQQLTAANIRVVVDVQGLAPGEYEVTPVASINIGQIPAANISVLPGTIGVSIMTDDTLTATPEAEPTE